jgi:hypothetical protein
VRILSSEILKDVDIEDVEIFIRLSGSCRFEVERMETEGEW